MEDSVPKLPAYMFRRSDGTYRYKRNVPKKLVSLVGIRTKYMKLGNTYAEAMKAYPQVHAAIEALFALEANKSSGERALEIIRARLGEDFGDLVRAETGPGPWQMSMSQKKPSRRRPYQGAVRGAHSARGSVVGTRGRTGVERSCSAGCCQTDRGWEDRRGTAHAGESPGRVPGVQVGRRRPGQGPADPPRPPAQGAHDSAWQDQGHPCPACGHQAQGRERTAGSPAQDDGTELGSAEHRHHQGGGELRDSGTRSQHQEPVCRSEHQGGLGPARPTACRSPRRNWWRSSPSSRTTRSPRRCS